MLARAEPRDELKCGLSEAGGRARTMCPERRGSTGTQRPVPQKDPSGIFTRWDHGLEGINETRRSGSAISMDACRSRGAAATSRSPDRCERRTGLAVAQEGARLAAHKGYT
ncbi:hypothetical protein NDU88_001292 [Pleurodeles waltl]|uniref:Uncharacterized protein n=1 Tax=Pleurodeles waltl TaxID=8319 RepID=A0AAV7WN60_PLEWA|nr:hypothetical protein NDU88_001292 [Pleurodeles waltl]